MPVTASVRMYRLLELGDCFLLTFTSGSARSRVLIDCGSFRNTGKSIPRLQAIVADIAGEAAGDPLDVVVGTHQHNDHLSGFVHCAQEFRDIGIRQVWLSWLDDPRDRIARAVGDTQKELKRRLVEIRRRLQSAQSARGLRALETLNDLLAIQGAAAAGPPEVPAKGTAFLQKVGKERPEYLRPGRTLDLPGLPGGAVKVHVLGPPRIEGNELVYKKEPRRGQTYDPHLAFASVSASRFLDAVNLRHGAVSREEAQYPFAEREKRKSGDAKVSPALRKVMERYRRKADAWRKIDNDWLAEAEALALYLDDYTNNSSLVLAVELVEKGKVLLFAGDAQAGNWLSWSDVRWETAGVSTGDLLSRTVLYKVGHHASHNATLVDVFERMIHPDLVALIPVHKQDPNITKANGWKMPARNLLKRLIEKADHRVLQMDCVHAEGCDPEAEPAKRAWKRIGVSPRVTDLFVEVDVVG